MSDHCSKAMEDIVQLCSGLSLTADEKQPIPVHDIHMPADDLDLCLVGKILAPRIIPPDQISSSLQRQWNPKQPLKCKPLHDNVMFFQFSDPADKARVLEGEPWLFDNFLLVLRRAFRNMISSEIPFTTSLWVHVHGVPTDLMNEDLAERVGNRLGKYIQADKDSDGSMIGSFVRLRCEIDITKPLLRALVIEDYASVLRLGLQYEKLPEFCSYRGLIGHIKKDCDSRQDDSIINYPSWLRTNPNISPFYQCMKTLEVEFRFATIEEMVQILSVTLPKQSTVEDILKEIKIQVELSQLNAELRLLEIYNHKINKIFPLNEKIEDIEIEDQDSTLRAEEIPEEEKNLGSHDRLIHVYHFTLEPFKKKAMRVREFGEPFFLVVHEGETMGEVKERVQKRLQVPHGEFYMWEFELSLSGWKDSCYPLHFMVVSDLFQWEDIHGPLDLGLGLKHSLKYSKF